MISNIVRQIYQANYGGKRFEVAEVGKDTWKEIIDEVDSQRQKRMTDEEKADIKEIYFIGVKLRMNPEVEEDKLFPVEQE